MANFFATTAMISFNGVPFVGQECIKSVSVNVNENLSDVQGMTSDHSISGFARGPRTITAQVEIYLPDMPNSVPDLTSLDYESNNYSLIVQAGSGSYNGAFAGKTYILQNIAYDGQGNSLSQIGQPGVITVNFKAQTYNEVN
jgi:hypothetical protein